MAAMTGRPKADCLGLQWAAWTAEPKVQKRVGHLAQMKVGLMVAPSGHKMAD